MFQCGVCKSEYDRSDHLLRHIRSHTNQRPFICSICTKGFARQDLLKRHIGTHDKDGSTASSRESFIRVHSRGQNQRVHQACRCCAAKKLKCSEQKPCSRCTEKNIRCEFEPDSEIPQKDDNLQSVAGIYSPQQPSNPIDQYREPAGLEMDSEFSFQRNLEEPTSSTSFETSTLETNAISCQDDFMHDILYGTLNIPDIGDFIQQDSESTLGDLDFSFLNHTSSPKSPPPSAEFSLPHIPPATSQPYTVGFGSEAFRKSDVHNGWEPSTEDHHRQEYPNLILPHSVRPEDLKGLSESPLMSHKSMSSLMRDRVLAMILRSSCSVASDRIIKSFPSLEVLNDLIRLAFEHMREHQVIQVIHLPSIILDDQRPEFLGSLIAYGSVYSPSQTVRKFGYALQEIVRAAILRLVSFVQTHLPI
jgi:hypothetical protein